MPEQEDPLSVSVSVSVRKAKNRNAIDVQMIVAMVVEAAVKDEPLGWVISGEKQQLNEFATISSAFSFCLSRILLFAHWRLVLVGNFLHGIWCFLQPGAVCRTPRWESANLLFQGEAASRIFAIFR